MPGINRFNSQLVNKSLGATNNFSEQTQSGRPCVFVSYKGDDRPTARAIVEVLLAADIDVYFDENDKMLTIANISQNHENVVRFIENGIAASTHILVVLSNKTKESWWVAFEIGSARRKSAHVAYVVRSEVKELPSYLKIATQLTSDLGIHEWIKKTLPNYITKSISFSESKLIIPGIPWNPRTDIEFYEID